MLPLEGLQVLDLSRLLPGGYATFLLASLGAHVVKVEEPGSGDYVRWTPPMHGEISSSHLALNRGKRSITLNLKAPGAAEVLERLAETADVLVESFRPGVLDRLGVGWSRLHEVNPRLIWCAITGYGQTGPYRDRAGHDVDYLAYAGVLDLIGVADGPAVIPGVQIADLGGGALPACIGILAAIVAREGTGEGSFVDTSMTDAAFGLATLAGHAAGIGAPAWRRGAGPISGGLACYRVYRCGDGLELAVGALEPKFFARLCDALGVPELAAKQLDPAEQPALMGALGTIFEKEPREVWLALLEPLEACVAPVRTIAEAMDDPQLQEREMIRTLPLPAGDVRVVASPIRIGDAPGAPASDVASRVPPPALGADTDAVLASVGYGPDEIVTLRSSGVL
jgi:crotonobetainyl-CoA:carnitine CoA-transferase CaiB-like acyl-CoA transferase